MLRDALVIDNETRSGYVACGAEMAMEEAADKGTIDSVDSPEDSGLTLSRYSDPEIVHGETADALANGN